MLDHPFILGYLVTVLVVTVVYITYRVGSADGYRRGWNDGWLDYKHFAGGGR